MPKLFATGLLLVVMIPGPAKAKLFDIEWIELSGPEMDRMMFSRDEFFVRRTIGYGSAHILGGFFQESLSKPPGPLEKLGPRYVVRYRLGFIFENADGLTVTQHLYPFAGRGPLAFTVPQEVETDFPDHIDIDLVVPGDWIDFPGRQIRKLQRLGLPLTAPLLAERPVTAPGAGAPTLIALAGLVVLLAFRPVQASFNRFAPTRM